MGTFIDMSGQRYGRLFVICRAGYLGPHIAWLCECDCGAEKVVRGHHLRYGAIVSCGCHKIEIASNRERTHGESNRSPEYSSWANMLHRCGGSAQDSDLRNYAGRGIAVCDRWRSYENFLADMGRRPSPGHSIDRIDNNGDYEPSNCRWALPAVQGNNKRTNRIVEYRGRKMTLKQAWDLSGRRVAYRQVRARIVSLGWPVAAALDTPALVSSGKREAGSAHWAQAA